MQELLEPLWDDILASARSVCLGIRGIWIADVAHQGESGILNERKIGNDREFTLLFEWEKNITLYLLSRLLRMCLPRNLT